MSAALILGSGRPLWSDLHGLNGAAPPIVFALNDMIAHYPKPIRYGVSHHADKLAHWLAIRPGAHQGIELHSSALAPGVHRVWPEYRAVYGSSALLAVRIALALNFRPVIVAGVPLDRGGHLWSDPEDPKPYDFARHYRKAWEASRAELVEAGVRGASGFLRDLLGAP